MDVSRIRALRGPNLWSRHTAIQAIVTCDGAETPSPNCPVSKPACASASRNSAT
jgi:cyanophycin synthetase